jgi:hypothetical protein
MLPGGVIGLELMADVNDFVAFNPLIIYQNSAIIRLAGTPSFGGSQPWASRLVRPGAPARESPTKGVGPLILEIAVF